MTDDTRRRVRELAWVVVLDTEQRKLLLDVLTEAERDDSLLHTTLSAIANKATLIYVPEEES